MCLGMTVRELVTKIKFELDKTGLTRSDQATEKVKQKLDAVGTAGTQAGTKIASGMNKAQQAANGVNLSNVTNSLNRATESSRKLGFSLRELSPITAGIQGVFQGIGQEIARSIGAAIQSIKQAGTEMQQLDGRLRSVTSSDKERNALEDKLFEVSQNSCAGITDVGDLYFKTARSKDQTGLNEQQNLDLTETVAKALTVGGADTAQKSATILQLSQALGSGVLQGDELRSLNENASGLMTEIAKYFNTTVGGLKKMGQEGELTSDKVAKAILASKKTIDEQFKKMPMTVDDATTEWTNTFKKGILELENSTGVFASIAAAIVAPIRAISTAVKWLSSAVGGSKNLIRILQVALLGLAGAIAYVKFGTIAKGIVIAGRAIRAFALANGLALGQLMLIAAVIAIVILAIQDLYTWINGGDSVIGSFLGSFDEFIAKNEWIQSMIGLFQTLWAEIQKLGQSLSEAFSQMDFAPVLDALGQAGNAVLPIISALFQAIGAVVIGVVTGVVWLITKFMELLNSGNVVAQVLTAAFNLFINNLISLFNLVTAVFTGNWSGAIDAVKNLFSGLQDFAMNVLSAIGRAIANFIGDKITSAKNAISDFLGWSDTSISGAVQNSQNASVTINQNISGGASVSNAVDASGADWDIWE